jgi:hypothetical protein
MKREMRTLEPQKRITESFFTYTLNFLALAGATTVTNTLSFEAQTDFRWIKACFFADIATAVQTDSSLVVPLVTILMSEGSGEQLSNIALPLNSIFGYGKDPFILPISRIFLGRSTINVQATNLTAATTYNLRLCFIGAKIYTDG